MMSQCRRHVIFFGYKVSSLHHFILLNTDVLLELSHELLSNGSKNVLGEATVTLTFNLGLPNSDQLIPHTKWTIVPNMKKFPKGYHEI